METVDKTSTVMHSFANVYDNTCATITDKQLIAIRARLHHSKTPTMSDVERIIRMDVQTDAHIIAGILYEVFTNPDLGLELYLQTNHPVTKVERGVNAYTPLGRLVTEDGKAALRKITEPFMLDAAHPTRSENSDQSCIKGRIHDVKNPVQSVPPFYHQCLLEFAKFLVPDHVANTLVPQDFSYIREQWKRPTQRALLERVKHVLFFTKPWAVKSFQKAEAYAKITHPRNISTLPTGFNARLGQFIYPYAEFVMKPAHWYAFGRAPAQIGRALMDKAQGATAAIVDDTTRLDGSCGKFHHLVNKTCILRAFSPEYKGEISSLLDREAHAHGFTSYGLHYTADYNTLSGSSDTSCKNSTTTAFLHYLERRIAGLKPKAAYDALGIYGGDDGVTFDCDQPLLSKVYAKTGLLVKTDLVQSGNPVPFLGRIFLDPWTCPNSIADVPRQLRKLHLSATPSTVPTDMILLRKAEAILVTDPETPILSVWARRVVEFTHHIDVRAVQRVEHLIARDLSYWSKFEDPFPPSSDKDLVRTIVKQMFKEGIVDKLEQHLNNAKTLAELPLLIDDTPPKVDINAVVDGIVVVAKPSVSHQAKIKLNAKTTISQSSKVKTRAEPRADRSIAQHPKYNTKSRIPVKVQNDKTKQRRADEMGKQSVCRNIAKFGTCKRQRCRFFHPPGKSSPGDTHKPAVSQNTGDKHVAAPNPQGASTSSNNV